uniref:Uncharacterized protein n=1 Tax=Solanum tuberosum TaxID=4113 RepID=M1DXX7_SOLTU
MFATRTKSLVYGGASPRAFSSCLGSLLGQGDGKPFQRITDSIRGARISPPKVKVQLRLRGADKRPSKRTFGESLSAFGDLRLLAESYRTQLLI